MFSDFIYSTCNFFKVVNFVIVFYYVPYNIFIDHIKNVIAKNTNILRQAALRTKTLSQITELFLMDTGTLGISLDKLL